MNMSNMSMVQKVSVGLGAFYVLIGVLGFVPGITQATAIPGQGMLLGIFAVNLIHNIAHLLLGAILIFGGMNAANVGMTLKAMAVIFAVLVVGSFIAPIVEGVAINPADTLLHLASALLTGYFGFMAKGTIMRTA